MDPGLLPPHMNREDMFKLYNKFGCMHHEAACMISITLLIEGFIFKFSTKNDQQLCY